jgi:hypothetical protein
LAARYLVDWYNRHFVQLPCLKGDANEARKYFDRLFINGVRDWRQDEWKACRAPIGRCAEGFQSQA